MKTPLIDKRRAGILMVGCLLLCLFVSIYSYVLGLNMLLGPLMAVVEIVVFVAAVRVYHQRKAVPGEPYANFSTEFLVGCLATLPLTVAGLIYCRHEGLHDALQGSLEQLWVGVLVGSFPTLIELGRNYSGQQIVNRVPLSIVESERLVKLGQHQDAEEKLCEILHQMECHFGTRHPKNAELLRLLGQRAAARGEEKKGVALLGQARQVYTLMLGPEAPEVTDCTLELLKLQPKEAGSESLEAARLSRERQFGGDSLPVAEVLRLQGAAKAEEGDWAGASQLFMQSYQLHQKHCPENDANRLGVSADYCKSLTKIPDYKECDKVANATLDIYRKQQLPQDESQCILYYCAGICARSFQRGATEAQHLRSALSILTQVVGPATSMSKEILNSSLDILYPKDSPSRPLFDALLSGDSMLLRRLIDASPDILKETDAIGWQILQWAVFLEAERVLDTLLYAGAPVDGPPNTEWPPLHIAIRWGYRRIVQTLLTKGAQVTEATPDGWTVAHRVSQSGDERMLDQLLQKGAPVNHKNKDGDSPIQLAVRSGAARLVVELLANGASSLSTNESTGLSIIHEAAQRGLAPVVECLVLNSAEVLTQQDSRGRTAGEVARQNGHNDLAKFIERSVNDVAEAERDQERQLEKEREKKARLERQRQEREKGQANT